MRLVFMGNPEFSLPALRALADSRHTLLAAVTSPDRPRGRGRRVTPVPVKEAAEALGLPVFQPKSLKAPEFLEPMRSLEVDAFVVVAFRILPSSLFTIPRYGSINIHPSLLPRGRGPAPIQWTLIRGETETGVSIIQLSERIDGGAILRQERSVIEPHENFGDLHDRLGEMGARMVVTVLDELEDGCALAPILQDEAGVTSAPKLQAKDYLLDWSQGADELRNRIRAFSPVPGASTTLDGTPFKILEAQVLEGADLRPGELRHDGDFLVVGTGSGQLRLERVKPSGKRAMTSEEFLRGYRSLPERFDSY